MKIFITDQNKNNRFPIKANVLLAGDLVFDLDKLSTLKIKLSRQTNKTIFDYIYNNQNVGVRIQDGDFDFVFIKGNAEVKTDAQDIGEFNFFGSFYDITYKNVNYAPINRLISGSIQDILETIAPEFNYQYIGVNPPIITINIGAMDNLNLVNEAMKQANCQWREIGVINGRETIEYGDFNYIQAKNAVFDYIKIDNYWSNNQIKLASWEVKENAFRYDYVRFYNDKGGGTDQAVTFDDSVPQDSNYPVVSFGQEYWCSNGIVTANNPKFVTKVINVPDSQNLSAETIKQILYNNAISFFQSTQDDEAVSVQLISSKILLAGDKLLVILKQNNQQKRFIGTLRAVKYDLITKQVNCQLVANPRKNLKSTNQSLLYNIKNESYIKKYTPIN